MYVHSLVADVSLKILLKLLAMVYRDVRGRIYLFCFYLKAFAVLVRLKMPLLLQVQEVPRRKFIWKRFHSIASNILGSKRIHYVSFGFIEFVDQTSWFFLKEGGDSLILLIL